MTEHEKDQLQMKLIIGLQTNYKHVIAVWPIFGNENYNNMQL